MNCIRDVSPPFFTPHRISIRPATPFFLQSISLPPSRMRIQEKCSRSGNTSGAPRPELLRVPLRSPETVKKSNPWFTGRIPTYHGVRYRSSGCLRSTPTTRLYTKHSLVRQVFSASLLCHFRHLLRQTVVVRLFELSKRATEQTVDHQGFAPHFSEHFHGHTML